MENLEKKIEDWCEANSTNGGNIAFDIDVNKNFSWDNEKLVKVSDIVNFFPREVKDIAIAFANFNEEHINDVKQGYASKKTEDELFQEFIEKYYK